MTSPEPSAARDQLMYIDDEQIGMGIVWQPVGGFTEVRPEHLQELAMNELGTASDRLAKAGREQGEEYDDLPTVTWDEDRHGFTIFPYIRIDLYGDMQLTTRHWRIGGGER